MRDSALPVVDVLLGDNVGGLLTAVGPVLDSRVALIRYRPGRSIVVQYRVTVEVEDGAADRMMVAAVGLDPPSAVTVLSDGTTDVAVWEYPDDPFLPGLPHTTTRGALGRLLQPMGVGSVLRTRSRAYHATRRAVIEAETDAGRLFVKVVRPEHAGSLERRHRSLAAEWPSPAPLGWSAEAGLVVLAPIEGVTLRNALESGEPTPSPAALVDVLDRLPDHIDEPAAGTVVRAHRQVALLEAVVPDLAPRIRSVLDIIDDLQGPDGPPVPVHGDFHASQVMVADGAVSGVVDVDTVGRGSRIDDLANALGHLSTLTTGAGAAEGLSGYLSEMLSVFEHHVDPVALRARAAASVIALSPGPFRVLEAGWPDAIERRLTLAESWLAGISDRRSPSPPPATPAPGE